ncbi:hypothetical protein H0H93_008378 [Arthromyces matolae]|nr:hypothetical protein H0H93_008378 [Arthromyces matolae]
MLPGSTKRKAADDVKMTTTTNPLLNGVKKAKREVKSGASAKRKRTYSSLFLIILSFDTFIIVANAEEQPGGLRIVRIQNPPSSSAPTPTTTAPPTKKFKSLQPSLQSQLPTNTSKPPSNTSSSSLLPSSQPTPFTRYDTPDADPALDVAARQMESEAADLRRASRGPTQIPSSSSSATSKVQFSASKPTSNGHAKRREKVVDVSKPLPGEDDETPQIQRNKRLRAGAMAAIASGSGSRLDDDADMVMDPVTPQRKPGESAPGSHRRKSSVGGRGKRISSAFQTTGIITQPHNSVSDSSFYKHIDSDLPDSDRVRQLLIWCSARASFSPPSPSDPTSSLPPLSSLSTSAHAVLKATQEGIIRRLAERRVDLSLFGASDQVAEPLGKLAENRQNVTNRTWEGVYGRHIQRATEEEEAWKKTGYAYDAYARRSHASLEKRRAEFGLSPLTSSPTPGSSSSTTTPSAKAKGKQRSLEPSERELPTSFQAGMRIAKQVLAKSSRARRKGLDPTPSSSGQAVGHAEPEPGPSSQKGLDPDSRPLKPASSTRFDIRVDVDMGVETDSADDAVYIKDLERDEEEDRGLQERMKDVQFKLDHLYVMASQARQTTEVAQLALDQRFAILARALDVRNSAPSSEPGVLERYVVTGESSKQPTGKETNEADEALMLLRALARVDAARPPAQVGDAARRAVREVQRVGEGGIAGGDRRITEVPATPRKAPGTPRRGATPRK